MQRHFWGGQMKVTIDRLEGKFAVTELPDGRMIDVPKELFEEAFEGAAYEIKQITPERKDRIRRLMNEVWEDEVE
jgi:hypothetical protein